MKELTSALLGVRRAAKGEAVVAGAVMAALGLALALVDADLVDVAAAVDEVRLRAVVAVAAAVVAGARVAAVFGVAAAAVTGLTVVGAAVWAGTADARSACVLAPPPPHALKPMAPAATRPTNALFPWVHAEPGRRTTGWSDDASMSFTLPGNTN